MLKLSVVIITLNEEKNLGRCLQSVREIADEIVIADSGSTDNTFAIAEAYGARVVIQPFLGYVAQKNFATDLAVNDWVLNLDADEVLSAALIKSIRNIKESDTVAYTVSRLTNYCGSWIRHSGWYPDVKIRLYNRKKGSWRGEQIHEYWQADHQEGATGALKGPLYHYSYHSISDHLKQIEKFSEILARRAVAAGKESGILKVVFAPVWKFITSYFIRLGILDGYPGFLVCRLSAFATFVKYSKIRQYAGKKKRGEAY
ncbi:MAG: glycosyltransferase family 2 protein [Sphingobacteriales bacterium]|nr:MAG: glycosyltransferase family 2 protein [Sphingobacteriales bacterium]